MLFILVLLTVLTVLFILVLLTVLTVLFTLVLLTVLTTFRVCSQDTAYRADSHDIGYTLSCVSSRACGGLLPLKARVSWCLGDFL